MRSSYESQHKNGNSRPPLPRSRSASPARDARDGVGNVGASPAGAYTRPLHVSTFCGIRRAVYRNFRDINGSA
jgi:hypothetical protein